MALTRRWVVTGFLASVSLIFMYALAQIPAASTAASQPFMIKERTEYGIVENNVYLTFTDTSDKAQYITNITFVFADSEKTRQIAVSDFLMKQSYLKDVYGYSNTSLGKYSKMETNCTMANATQVCKDYYVDGSGDRMGCDYVLADKNCLKKVYGVAGTVAAYDYLPAPNTKQKTVTNGLKIEQKVEGSVPLAKGGTAEIKITMPHPLFYGITVANWENKYSIIACSQYGCSELDPTWWDASYGYRYAILENTTTELDIAVNDTYGVNGHAIWARIWNDSYVYSTGAGLTGTIAIANQTHQKFWENETSHTGNGLPSLWNAGVRSIYHFGNTSGTTAYDTSASAYNGTIIAPCWNSSGIFGYALGMNDNNDYVVLPDAATKNMPTGTVSFWVKRNTTGDLQGLFTRQHDGVSSYLTFEFMANNKIGWLVTDAMGEKYSTDAFGKDTWLFVVGTWNGINAILYVNGTVQSTTAFAGGVPDTAVTRTVIGTRWSLTNGLHGLIDEVRIYTTAMSADWVNQQYFNGLGNLTALGAEEVPPSIVLTINSPTNTTYNSAIKINGSTDVSGNVSYSVDGGGNLTACVLCTAFENFTTLADGAHVVRIYANVSDDGAKTDNETVYFSVDTVLPYITIVKPSGTYVQNATIPLDYAAADTYSTISKCWYSLNNATNVSLAGCANNTLAITQAGIHNVSVFANDTANNTNGTSVGFIYDPFQNFTANGSVDGEKINIFQLLVLETSGSYSTTNGTIPVPISAIGLGSRTLRFISTGYNTTDFIRIFNAGTLQTQNYTLLPASLNISVFDEGQAAVGIWTNLTFNITITNSTISTTWYNRSSFFKYMNDTPVGSITVDLSSAGYVPRRYYFNANVNIANKFTAYLLQSADALLVRFHIHNNAGSSISGASVNASRFLGGSWSIVSQQTSDESGIAAMYLYPFAIYTVAAGKTGFTATSITIQPSATDYVITLQSAGAAAVFETATTNVTAVFTPTIASLNATLTAFMCQVNSSDNSLERVNFNITHYNGTVWYANSTAVTSNLTLNTSVDLTFENGTNLTALCSFKRAGFGWVVFNRTYYVYNITGGALERGAAAARAQYSRMTLGLISIVITAIVAGGIGGIGRNTLAGALAGLIALGIFTFIFGWFDWQAYILICAVFGSVMYLRSGV